MALGSWVRIIALDVVLSDLTIGEYRFFRGWGNKINELVWNKALIETLDLASKIKKYISS